MFVAFSWLFGGERAEAEAPVSTRFRYYTDAAYGRSGKDSGKEMKQVAYVPPCPEWYGDREWNVNLWGTYAFTNTEFAPNPSLIDIVQSTSEGGPVLGTYDRYIGGDHAWGGGGDVKYFFCRYAGVGVEGFALDATSLVSISSRTSRSRYLFNEESITIIPSALSLARLHCGIQFRARVLRLMHGRVWARFSAAEKGTTSHARTAGRICCQCADRTFRE